VHPVRSLAQGFLCLQLALEHIGWSGGIAAGRSDISRLLGEKEAASVGGLFCSLLRRRTGGMRHNQLLLAATAQRFFSYAPGKRPARWEAPDFPRQRPAPCPLTLGNVGGSPTPGNHTAETGLAGWGERIRTSELQKLRPSNSMHTPAPSPASRLGRDRRKRLLLARVVIAAVRQFAAVSKPAFDNLMKLNRLGNVS
jgi:hypothetical protein